MVLDYGSSSLKCLFDTELTENPQYFMMEPEVIEVSAEALEEYRQSFAIAPAKNAIIGVDDRYYAVGELAQQEFRSTLNLDEPKLNYGVQRTLAAVSVAIALSKIKLGKIRLFLACLLPPGELRDRDMLENSLRQALKQFITPIGQLGINLYYFRCHPEGGGLSFFYKEHRKGLGDRSVGVIMMGHRNASCFTIQNNVYEKFRSSHLGFATVVSDIQSNTSAYREKNLTVAVSQYLMGKPNDRSILDKLLLRNTPEGRVAELEQLLKTISTAKSKFWNSFSQWLTIQFPQIDEVIFGGGVAKIFELEMIDYFKEKLPNLPEENHSAIYLQGGLKYPQKTLIPVELQARFADIQCLWEEDILRSAESYWQRKNK
jgi:hypothetical protein